MFLDLQNLEDFCATEYEAIKLSDGFISHWPIKVLSLSGGVYSCLSCERGASMNYLYHEYRIRQKFHPVASVLPRPCLYQLVISSAIHSGDDRNMNMYLRGGDSFLYIP